MPTNPLDQNKAMFTIQRGPKKAENEMSVSVDASSIETVEPLDEISEPEEKQEYKSRQTKIIALLGLDTISTALGFEDKVHNILQYSRYLLLLKMRFFCRFDYPYQQTLIINNNTISPKSSL